jgi:hypothetical protein
MIFYITTYERSRNNALKIKEMFSKTNYEFYFVYGRNQQNKVEPYIEVDIEEKYENLPLKTYFLLEHYLKNTRHDYIFKMDDDTFIDFKLFNPINFPYDYTGMFLTYPEDLKTSIFHWYTISTPEYRIPMKTFDLKYAEGGAYILSRKAAQRCYDKGYSFYDSTPETYLGEDTKIGMCLTDSDITVCDLLYNKDLLYETTKDLMLIHPVHHLLFDKLHDAETREDKINILRRYNYLNLNFKREIYLTNTIKELQSSL